MCYFPVARYSEDFRDRIIGFRPCGICEECVLSRIAAWSFRGLFEMTTNTNPCWFLTFTYADNAPLFPQKSVAQKFKKRWLKLCGKNKGIISGECGDENDRTHYHYVVFGAIPEWYNPNGRTWIYNRPDDPWKYGMIDCRPAFPEDIGYVCGYAVNRDSLEKEFNHINFALFSQGIGKDYVLKNKDSIVSGTHVFRDAAGKVRPIPQSVWYYIFKDLGLDRDSELDVFMMQSIKVANGYKPMDGKHNKNAYILMDANKELRRRK